MIHNDTLTYVIMILEKKAQGKILVLILFAKKVKALLKSCAYCGKIHDKNLLSTVFSDYLHRKQRGQR